MFINNIFHILHIFRISTAKFTILTLILHNVHNIKISEYQILATCTAGKLCCVNSEPVAVFKNGIVGVFTKSF